MITKEQFKSIFPQNKEPELWSELLSDILPKYEIDTKQEIAAFISQCGHESGGFTIMSENLNYSEKALLAVFGKYFNSVTAKQYARKPEQIANRVYANRMGNGPESSGDGWTYRGGGIIQCTGKNNYLAASQYLYGNNALIQNPRIVSEDKVVAIQVACWYWKINNLNSWVVKGDFDGLSDLINIGRKTSKIGDSNGYADRKAKYDKLITLL